MRARAKDSEIILTLKSGTPRNYLVALTLLDLIRVCAFSISIRLSSYYCEKPMTINRLRMFFASVPNFYTDGPSDSKACFLPQPIYQAQLSSQLVFYKCLLRLFREISAHFNQM